MSGDPASEIISDNPEGVRNLVNRLNDFLPHVGDIADEHILIQKDDKVLTLGDLRAPFSIVSNTETTKGESPA